MPDRNIENKIVEIMVSMRKKRVVHFQEKCFEYFLRMRYLIR